MALRHRDAGEQRHFLGIGRWTIHRLLRMKGDAGGRQGIDRRMRRVSATAMTDPQPRRRHDAIGLGAAMAMGEDEFTVAIEKVGDAQGSHLGREGRHDLMARGRRWGHLGLPQDGEPFQQQAEGSFRIGLAHGAKAVLRPGEAGNDVVEAAVVGEQMHAAAQFACERLGIGKAVATAGRPADVRHQQLRGMRMSFDECEPGTSARRFRLLVEAHVAPLVEGDAPAVDIAPIRRAMRREVPERERGPRRMPTGQAEEFAHGADDSMADTVAIGGRMLALWTTPVNPQEPSTMSNDDETAAIRGVAFMDGRWMPLAEAAVPILDRGFVRSDATYDVAHVWKGRFFRLMDHVERFQASMAGLRMSLPYSAREIADIMIECASRSGLRDAYVQVTCTRGLPPAGTRDPRLCRNRLYAFAQPFVWIADENQRRDGLNMVLSRTQRIPPESLDQRIKNFHWLDLTMGIFEAYDRDATVAILPAADGSITEGPGFNIFVVKDGALATPARGLFEGITRRTVIEIAADLQLRCEVRAVHADEVAQAGEIFISSTAGGIMPVTRYEGRSVGDGRPGALTRRIEDLYWQRHEDDACSTPVPYSDRAAGAAPEA